jgi:hypothetical protein
MPSVVKPSVIMLNVVAPISPGVKVEIHLFDGFISLVLRRLVVLDVNSNSHAEREKKRICHLAE